MLRHFSILLLLAGSLLASAVDLHSPSAAVTSYYDAMNEGDIAALEQIMVPESFDMNMQVYALSIALNDEYFHTILKQYGNSLKAREIVLKEVTNKLRNRPKRSIADLKVNDIGYERAIVRFKEEGKPKQLYLSLHDSVWKIDYKAGRKTD